MEELLKSIIRDLGTAGMNLAEANRRANSVQSLVIIPLIGRARELRRDVDALLSAIEADKTL